MRLVPAALVVLIVAVACTDSRVESPVVGLAGFACGIDVRGGGVVVDEGLVLTAAHVLAGVEDGVDVVTTDGGRHAGVVVAFDPDRDLALVAVGDVPVAAADFSVADGGDAGVIVAVGPDAESREYTFEVVRRVTATGGDIYGEGDTARLVLEVTADVDPGASGAPAVVGDGHVVGIVVSESRTRGVAYVIDTTEIEAFLAEPQSEAPVRTGPCR